MKRILLVVAVMTLGLGVCAPPASAATPVPVSMGCDFFNNPQKDGEWSRNGMFNFTFFAGERLFVEGFGVASGSPTGIALVIEAPNSPITTLTAGVNGLIEYTIPVTGAYPTIEYRVDPIGSGTAYFQVTCVPNKAPDCSNLSVSPTTVKADGKLHEVTVSGGSDTTGSVTTAVTGVTQDEPTTGGWRNDVLTPDAGGAGDSTVSVRGERNPTLNGRVYRIAVTVTDAGGATCTGLVTVGVRVKKAPAVDDGTQASWDSFTGQLV